MRFPAVTNWLSFRLWREGDMSALSNEPLDPRELEREVSATGFGAIATFAGIVRDEHAGRTVTRLDYSAYHEMAESACAEVVAEAESRFGARVRLKHRLGSLAVGDTAVIVVAAAPHRGAAFDACRWAIDEVKRRVPIWKHEHYADGTTAWVDPTTRSGTIPSARPAAP